RCGRVTVPALPVKVVDTVGAGDSFQAALLARLAQYGLLTSTALSKLDRNAISDALHYATFAASLTCERRGADLPRLAELDRLMVAQSNGPEKYMRHPTRLARQTLTLLPEAIGRPAFDPASVRA